MKIGDVISLREDSTFRQIIDIKRGNLLNIFVLQNILISSEIIEIDGYHIRSECFRIMNKQKIITHLKWVENFYLVNGWKITWNNKKVLNRIDKNINKFLN